MQVTVLKLGGSILTEEVAGACAIRTQRLRRLASELAGSGPAVVVHGSGAFGKPPARLYGYVDGHLAQSASAAVFDISQKLETLHSAVLNAVREAGRPACSFQAVHLVQWESGALRLAAVSPLRHMLERGATPVVASGFVPDLDSGGFVVASSDAIAALLAQAMGAQVLAFATDADGVYTRFPDTSVWHRTLASDDLDALSHVLATPGDVTGGMAEKLRHGFEGARAGIRTLVLDGRLAGNVAQALAGHPFRGTELVSSSRGLTRAHISSTST